MCAVDVDVDPPGAYCTRIVQLAPGARDIGATQVVKGPATIEKTPEAGPAVLVTATAVMLSGPVAAAAFVTVTVASFVVAFAGVVVIAGLGAEIVTVAPCTVNVTVLLVPPGVVTVTSLAPRVGLRAIVNVAVIWVPAAFTVVPLIVIPVMGFIVAPARFVPVMVTGTA